MACLFTIEIVFTLAFSRRPGARLTNALRVSCAYAEYVLRTFKTYAAYVLRTFNIRCIRSNYAARRLVMRYAYASHTFKTVQEGFGV